MTSAISTNCRMPLNSSPPILWASRCMDSLPASSRTKQPVTTIGTVAPPRAIHMPLANITRAATSVVIPGFCRSAGICRLPRMNKPKTAIRPTTGSHMPTGAASRASRQPRSGMRVKVRSAATWPCARSRCSPTSMPRAAAVASLGKASSASGSIIESPKTEGETGPASMVQEPTLGFTGSTYPRCRCRAVRQCRAGPPSGHQPR